MTTKNQIILGVVLAVIAFTSALVGVMAAKNDSSPLGGGVYQALPWAFNSGIKVGTENEQWVSKDIPAGDDQVVLLTNTSGKPMLVDYTEVQPIANARGVLLASSTYSVIVTATTSSSVPNSQDFTALASDLYTMARGVWATSTAATSTNSVGSVTLGGQGAFYLPDGSSLIAYVNRTGRCITNGALCETATSTSRGFDLRARAHYHFDD